MKSQYEKFESLFELTNILNQQHDFQEMLRLLSSRISIMFHSEITSILMVNPRTQETIKTVVKEGAETTPKQYRVLETNVIGWVMKHQQPFLSADIRSDDRFRKNLFQDTAIHSVMCAPLQSGGSHIGYLVVLNKRGDPAYNSASFDLLEKLATIAAPFINNVQKIEEYFHVSLPNSALLTKYEALGLLGKSPQFVDLLRGIESAIRCDVRVMLEGESGTGKELIARAIHKLSARSNHPFIAIDCGAIPEHLMESELFGHVKGAFTGAVNDRKGLIETANGGTVFMDEITNLPLDMQAKFLRVLQESEIRPVGSNLSRKVDVRFISASSKKLRELLSSQSFREDLYYRLYVYPLQVPTLNERSEDIPLLANYFLNKYVTQQKKQAQMFHRSIVIFLKQRKWTGNIRELENFVERLVTLAPPEMEVLDQEILPPEFQKEFKKIMQREVKHPLRKSLQESLEEYEEQMVRQTLKENDWNQSQTARSLQVSEQTVRYKMAKFGIVKPS
jgi:transcriptional regulator with GAF, ATPase, and Fis domain